MKETKRCKAGLACLINAVAESLITNLGCIDGHKQPSDPNFKHYNNKLISISLISLNSTFHVSQSYDVSSYIMIA